MLIDRRTLLLAGLAATTVRAQTPTIETFTDWLHASPDARDAALQPSVDRIRRMDEAIQCS